MEAQRPTPATHRAPKRRLLRFGALVWAAAFGVIWGMGACQGGGQTSGESHFGRTKAFLRICEDGRCESGDDCACAVCTVSCEGLQQCRDRITGGDPELEVPSSVVCRAPLCGDNVNDEATPDVGAVCDVECASDADCAFLDRGHDGDGHFCNAGYCRTLAAPDSPGEVVGELPSPCPTGMSLVPGSAVPGGVGVCLDLTEVTVEQYVTCVDAGACSEPDAGNYLTAGREQHPVHFVSLPNAQAFCAWRSARLPSFDERQAAAMGGSAERAYPWGDEIPSAGDAPARVCGLGVTTTCEVGSFTAGDGAFGHADLAGNVAEWVSTADGHCLAGGDFASAAEDLEASACVPADQDTPPSEATGIRCARDL